MTFTRVVELLRDINAKNTKITIEEYEQFKREYTFAALEGFRYGEFFCNKFTIIDGTLYNYKTTKLADAWIKQNYIK